MRGVAKVAKPAVEPKPVRSRGEGVQSVARAARLLMLVAEGRVPPTVTALAGAAGLAVPTTHHLLRSLIDSGLLGRDHDRRYVLGPRIGVLAEVYQRTLEPPAYLVDPLHQLATTTGETSYLMALRNQQIHILASVEGTHPVHVSVPARPYADAHARAGGKLMLAFMPEELSERYLQEHPLRALTARTIVDRDLLLDELRAIRERGYATEDEEFHTGVSCIAAPVLDADFLIAGYSISVPTHRYHERRDELTRSLLDITAAAQRRLLHGGGESDGT
jgi:IclR family transcriptional regulator, acetate operon repressor